jgi:hypothetical protein
MRNVLLIVLGLVIGVVGTAMAMNALRSGPHIGESLMHVQGFHMEGLDKNVKTNRCAVTDNMPHLQTLRMLANDIEPAFLPVEKEADFRRKASDLRASLDAVLAAPPADCPSVRTAQEKIGRTCKACHDEFRG